MKRSIGSVFKAAGLALLTGTAGCSMKPSFDTVIGPSDVGPQINDVMTHAQCELALLPKNPDVKQEVKDEFNKGQYVAFVTLTLEVTNTQNLTPTFSFVSVLSALPAGQTITKMFGFKAGGTQHRTAVVSQLWDLDPTKMNKDHIDEICKGKPEEPIFGGIKGSLGLPEIFSAGIANNSHTFVLGLINDPKAKGATAIKSASAIPTFGTTEDYTVVGGFSVGPQWALATRSNTQFKGPSGPSGLFATDTTAKGTLAITFASAATAATEKLFTEKLTDEERNKLLIPQQQNKELAGQAAVSAGTRMILQSIPGLELQ